MENKDYQKRIKELDGVVINIDPSNPSKSFNPLEIDQAVEVDTQLVRIIDFINIFTEGNNELTLNDYEMKKIKEVLTIAYERKVNLTIATLISEMIVVNKNNGRLTRLIDVLKKFV